MCPRRELNPYSPYGPQDFKSCVSTSSTTGAGKSSIGLRGSISLKGYQSTFRNLWNFLNLWNL